jgi:hypothetical protein
MKRRKLTLILFAVSAILLATSCTDDYGSNQCAAYTKQGTRCKRTAEKGSIYCWQHKNNH